MAEAHLDHPGDVTWFAGRGPKQGTGQACDHGCDHAFTCAVVGWGPDYDHYCLIECSECGCRAWTAEWPYPWTEERPKYRRGPLVQVTTPARTPPPSDVKP